VLAIVEIQRLLVTMQQLTTGLQISVSSILYDTVLRLKV
jgi:hypothetical protein